MVSKSNAIETDTICSCGNGDTVNPQKGYFENKCPICGNEGVLVVETLSNVEISNHSEDNEDTDGSIKTNGVKIVCKEGCGEFCGQDGYDLHGGTRASLTTISPYDITSDDDEASSTEEGDTTYMSGWEGLCDLLKPLDGQAMMVQRGDCVVIKRIDMPQTAKLWAYEGINVVDDSVSITDFTPEIYNTFIIKWGESFENELEFTINNHKKLFGERKIVIEAKKYSVVGEEDKNKSESSSVSDSISSTDVSTEDLEKVDTSNIDSSSLDTGNVNTGSGSSEEAPETEEVPIIDREEAIRFGLTQVGKAKRENGHTIELKVIGSTKWQMGEWCHVKLPSFNEDSYMFISKCSFESSPDNEFINSLTLVDYPPSLGKPDKKKEEDKEEDTSDNPIPKDDTDNNSNSDNNNDDNNEEEDNN